MNSFNSGDLSDGSSAAMMDYPAAAAAAAAAMMNPHMGQPQGGIRLLHTIVQTFISSMQFLHLGSFLQCFFYFEHLTQTEFLV